MHWLLFLLFVLCFCTLFQVLRENTEQAMILPGIHEYSGLGSFQHQTELGHSICQYN